MGTHKHRSRSYRHRRERMGPRGRAGKEGSPHPYRGRTGQGMGPKDKALRFL